MCKSQVTIHYFTSTILTLARKNVSQIYTRIDFASDCAPDLYIQFDLIRGSIFYYL